MKEIKNKVLKKNIETFSNIISKFLDNETLTQYNYYPEYRLFVKKLKQNFWELKVILSDEFFLKENLYLINIEVKKKQKEYDQNVQNTKVTFEKYHFVNILNYLKKREQNQVVFFRQIYINFFFNLHDEIDDYFGEKRRLHNRSLLYEKIKNERK